LYLSIIIPAYNETHRLPTSLTAASDYLNAQPWPAELIVVDDGSTDETCAIIRDFISQSATHSQQSKIQMHLISNDHRGKGYAVRTGMLAAQGQYILFTDADLATPITEVQRLLAYLEQGYDIAIGSREGLGAQRYGEPPFRHLMGRVFNSLVRAIVVGGFNDTQCGFKAFRHKAAHDLFGRLKIYGEETGTMRGPSVTAFDVEVLFLALWSGYRIKEVPVQWYYGTHSKVNPLIDSGRMLRDILRVRINAWRGMYDEGRKRC
jgi:glycosyltransferase involved in cell wall biosynthesis